MNISQAILDRNPQNPHEIKEALLEIKDEKERYRLIAIWAVHYGFDELRPKPMPSKPRKVIDFEAQPDEKKKKMNKDPASYNEYWRDSSVYNYYNTCRMIKDANIGNLQWLKDIKFWLDPARDGNEILVINNRIYEFATDKDNAENWYGEEN